MKPFLWISILLIAGIGAVYWSRCQDVKEWMEFYKVEEKKVRGFKMAKMRWES